MKHLFFSILFVCSMGKAFSADDSFTNEHFDSKSIDKICSDFEIKDKESDECVEQMKLVTRSAYIFCKIGKNNNFKNIMDCALKKSGAKSEKNISTFSCTSNSDETECSTPDGRLYKLVPSVNQSSRGIINKVNSQTDGDSIKTNTAVSK